MKHLSLQKHIFPFLSAILCICLFILIAAKSKFSFSLLINSFSQEVTTISSVTPIAIDAYKLAKKNKLSAFSLSASLLENAFLFQRIAEFCYPIRVVTKSKFIFATPSDKVYKNCIIADNTNVLILYRCD